MLSKSLKRFRSSFDIVQFSRSCLLSRSSLFVISGKCKFVKHFFDFSLSRSVEPLSFVTALLYYHAFHPLSTLFFNFLGIIARGAVLYAAYLASYLASYMYYTLYMEKEGTYAKVRSKQDNTNQPPYPVADMKCHLIRLTSFGTFPSRGRL